MAVVQAPCKHATGKYAGPSSPAVKPINLITLSELLLQADGSWRLRTKLPNDDELDTWLRISDAAKLLRVNRRDVYRWLHVYLVFRRPTAHRIEVSLKSVRDLQAATHDSEFWNDEARKKRLRDRVCAAMTRLAQISLQSV